MMRVGEAPMEELLDGCSQEDQLRLREVLRELFHGLDLEKVMFVGGLAIRWHLFNYRGAVVERPVGDIDLVAVDLEGVNYEALRRKFLISHFHPRDGYVQFVHRRTGVRVEVLQQIPELAHGVEVEFDHHGLRVVGLVEQLVKVALDIRTVLPGCGKALIDPKQFYDVELLLKVMGEDELVRADWLWRRWQHIQLPLLAAIAEAQGYAHRNPGVIRKRAGREWPLHCGECAHDPVFPLTPLWRIYARLALKSLTGLLMGHSHRV